MPAMLQLWSRSIQCSVIDVECRSRVGIGLASGKAVSKWRGDAASASKGTSLETMEQELLEQVIDGRESGVTSDQFPYYLRCPSPPCLSVFLHPLLKFHVRSFFWYCVFTSSKCHSNNLDLLKTFVVGDTLNTHP